LSYSFASSNPAVVSVDASGNVKALAAGSADIIVTASNAAQSGDLVARISVTVNPVQGGDVTPSALTLK
ncbi:MAG: Ig-like domain-containing protein, partial [Lachnospiraceae bacterium]|nr:Ig-like domain-containing protein [Lachnospiraceae bacterium]